VIDYTTPTAVFAYGNSAGTGNDPVNEAALMAQLVTAYSRAVDQYCNQAFSLANYTDHVERALVDESGVLTCYPAVPTISAISAMGVRTGVSFSPIDLGTIDIEANSFGCVVRVLGQSFAGLRGRPNLRVRLSYTGGWANLAAVPQNFQWAVTALCWWAYQKRSAPIDKTAYPDVGMVIIPSNWPNHIKQMLQPYVRWIPM
jgi:hypothetical protein